MESITKFMFSSSVGRTVLTNCRGISNHYLNAEIGRAYSSLFSSKSGIEFRTSEDTNTGNSKTAAINNINSRNCSTFLQSVRSCSSEPDEGQQNKWTELSYEDLCALINGGNIQLFDVREPKELREYGQIPNAVNIPLGQLYDALRMPSEKFERHFGVDKPDRDDENIIFTCLGGIRSQKALLLSKDIGYKKVRHYKGGWEEWSTRTNQPLKK